MATNLISFPFRVAPSGSVVTRPDDSSTYYSELIATLVMTKPGERPQVPLYGLTDPTFDQVNAQELVYKVGLFGPPVSITSVKMNYVDDHTQDVVVEFAPLQANAADINTVSA